MSVASCKRKGGSTWLLIRAPATLQLLVINNCGAEFEQQTERIMITTTTAGQDRTGRLKEVRASAFNELQARRQHGNALFYNIERIFNENK